MTRKTLSVQTAITLLLILLIVPLSVLIIVINYMHSTDSMRTLTRSLLENISEQTMDKSLNYLQPARRGLALSGGLAQEDILRSNNPKEIERYFRQLLIQYPEFVMLNYGQENGNFMMVKRMPDGSFSTKWIYREGDTARTEWIHEKAVWQDVYPNALEKSEAAYDPRKRPWYKNASARRSAIWTSAYIFFSDRKPGISCAAPIFSHTDQSLIGVVGIDMGIEEISKYIGGLQIGKSGKAFLINRRGEMLAYPAKTDQDLSGLLEEKEKDGQKSFSLRHILNSSDQAIAASYRTLMGPDVRMDSQCTISRIQEIRFSANGRMYAGTYNPFPANSDWPWIAGVLIPEDDFMGEIKKNNIITFGVSMTALLTALAVGLILARRITKPLAVLSEEARYIRDFDLEAREPVTSGLTEIMDLSGSIESMKKGLFSFEKYVPSELVRLLLQSGMEAGLGGKKQELTVLFSDIAGFTSISEQLSPEVLVTVLGEYLNEISSIIQHEQGTVDKFIGDAVMAFWGAPLPVRHHALQACRGALRCRQRLVELRQTWSQKGLPPFNTRFGINTGEVIVGNIGCETRMDYTVIGDNVNLASRLEGINKVYGTSIIVSESTARLVQDEMTVRILDYVAVAGKTEATAIFELMGEKMEISPETEAFVSRYAEALALYRNREWEEAGRLFDEAGTLFPDDRPVSLLYERCRDYMENPPPENWNGVFILRGK